MDRKTELGRRHVMVVALQESFKSRYASNNHGEKDFAVWDISRVTLSRLQICSLHFSS